MNRYANSEISLHVGGCGFDRQRGLVGFGGRAVHPDHIPIVASPFRDFADFGTAARQRRGSNRKLRLALIGTGWRDLSRRSGLCDSSLEEAGLEPSVPPLRGRSRTRVFVFLACGSAGRGGPVAGTARDFEPARPLGCLSCRARRTGVCGLAKRSTVIRNVGGMFGRTHVPDAGRRERQLVRHRPERGQSIADGIGHQAADRDDRALAGALDAERVAR